MRQQSYAPEKELDTVHPPAIGEPIIRFLFDIHLTLNHMTKFWT